MNKILNIFRKNSQERSSYMQNIIQKHFLSLLFSNKTTSLLSYNHNHQTSHLSYNTYT